MRIRAGLLCALMTLSACGGGGGGGGGGGSEGDSAYGVRALHAAIDVAPVDITSTASSSAVLSKQFFAGEKGYRSIPATGQTINITRAGAPGEVYGSFALSAGSQDRYTVLVYGDTTTFGLRTRLIKDEIPSSTTEASLRVVNGATGAADVTVTIGGASIEAVAFGKNSEYTPTAGGPTNVTVVRSADGSPLYSGTIDLKPGRAYTLLLAGEVGYFVKGVLFTDS